MKFINICSNLIRLSNFIYINIDSIFVLNVTLNYFQQGNKNILFKLNFKIWDFFGRKVNK